jgi:hypothetical protein
MQMSGLLYIRLILKLILAEKVVNDEEKNVEHKKVMKSVL